MLALSLLISLLFVFSKKVWSRDPEVVYGEGSPGSLPPKCMNLEPLEPDLICSYTGPDGGIAALEDQRNGMRSNSTGSEHRSAAPLNYRQLERPIAGSTDWCQKHDCAYGTAVSLYDQAEGQERPQGEPVADVFAIAVHGNSCVMALADGVGWGEKPRLAARCAVRGCMEYVHQELYETPRCLDYALLDTHKVTKVLLMSLKQAQNLIIQKEGTMTTLCIGMVCRLAVPDGNRAWALVTVNVGDSLAYAYSPTTGRVREVTVGSHTKDRDMKDAGGVLGPADGVNPDLENLTCSLTTVASGDMVFLTSDGISDNYDPVVLRKARPVPTSRTPAEQTAAVWMDLPLMTQAQRQEHQAQKMAEVLNGNLSNEDDWTARRVCAALVGFTVQYTHTRRELLQAPDVVRLSELSRDKRQEVQSRLEDDLRKTTGKLDHAAVVAFKVQQFAKSSSLTATMRRHATVSSIMEDLNNL